MKVYYGLSKLPDFRNTVITIGSFDGVHQGHKHIIKRICQLAKEINGESVVITFHPHPRLVLNPSDTTLHLLNTIPEKAALLNACGIDHLVVTPFSKDFYSQTPQEYIQNFLIQLFHPHYIVVGYDHRFGKDRVGDIVFLEQYQQLGNFKVIEIVKQEIDDMAISSSKIRKAIESTQIKTANKLLGYPYQITGKVVRGQQIGRSIGYPTANIEISDVHKLIPPFGIYAVYVILNNIRFKGMLYIGNRPTLPELNNITIEVNIFDFNDDIYDQSIILELVDYIRADQRFDTLDALKNQIAQDKIDALKVLA